LDTRLGSWKLRSSFVCWAITRSQPLPRNQRPNRHRVWVHARALALWQKNDRFLPETEHYTPSYIFLVFHYLLAAILHGQQHGWANNRAHHHVCVRKLHLVNTWYAIWDKLFTCAAWFICIHSRADARKFQVQRQLQKLFSHIESILRGYPVQVTPYCMYMQYIYCDSRPEAYFYI
jgi:hypothetical protein